MRTITKSLLCVLCTLMSVTANAGDYRVTDFGAKADGITLNTNMPSTT